MAPCENYCSRAELVDVLKSERKHKDLAISRAALLPFGYGDGGGGPTAEQLEKLRRLRGLANQNPGILPKHAVGETVDDFFDKIRGQTDNAKALLSFCGELVRSRIGLAKKVTI